MPTKLIRKQFLISNEENKKLERIARSLGVSVSNLARIKFGLAPLEMGRKKNNPSRKAARKNRER